MERNISKCLKVVYIIKFKHSFRLSLSQSPRFAALLVIPFLSW